MSNWIFLRGLMREARHWGDFCDVFRKALPEATVFTPDLPGNGVLYGIASPTQISGMVEHCRAALRSEGVKPPYHLLALSMGGMAARCWAERYPEEVGALVLISTSMRPHNAFYLRLQPRTYPTLARLALSGASPAQRESSILKLTSSQTTQTGAPVLQNWMGFAIDRPVSRINALRQLLAAARFRAQARSTAHPTLLLASRGDRLVHHRCSEQLAKAWRVDLALHPNAGHDIPLDDAPWVLNQILGWRAVRRNAGHSVD